MREASANTLANIARGVTTLCHLWVVTRKDGEVFRYTDHDQPLTVDGDLYHSRAGFLSSALFVALGSQFQGATVDFAGHDDAITEEAVRNKQFENVYSALYLVDHESPQHGKTLLFEGRVKSASWNPHSRAMRFNMGTKFDTQLTIATEVYSSLCRADFGDERCKYDILSAKQAATVTAVVSGKTFTIDVDLPDDHRWNDGLVTWTGGPNIGRSMEVTKYDSVTNNIQVALGMSFPVEVGHTLDIYPGCDKTLETCIFYENVSNMRAEPFLAKLTGYDEEN